MLDAERRHQIVALVEQGNGVTVAELRDRFGVSEATVRRDLAQLSKRGLIERAHGGAAPRRARRPQALAEPPLLKRAALQQEAKRRIGRAAASYVEDGDTIIVSGGTTTAEMVPHLVERRGLTVITNALNVAMLLAPHHNVTVVVPGGQLRHSELTLVGSLTEEALENLRATKMFMGIPAIHVDYGFSADNVAEVSSDRALLAAAQEVTVLADHTKFGRAATVRVAPVRRARRVITDSEAPVADLAALREQQVLVDVV